MSPQYDVNVEIVDRLFIGLHTFFALDLSAAVLSLVPAVKLLWDMCVELEI